MEIDLYMLWVERALPNSLQPKIFVASCAVLLNYSFIRPHLEYCAIVWDPHLTKDIEVLEKVQRFALRMCLKNWSLEHNQLYSRSVIPGVD